MAERSHAGGGDASGARRGRRPGEGEAHRRQRVSWSRYESDLGRRSGFRSQQTKRLRSNRPAPGEAPATQEAEARRRRSAGARLLLPRPSSHAQLSVPTAASRQSWRRAALRTPGALRPRNGRPPTRLASVLRAGAAAGSPPGGPGRTRNGQGSSRLVAPPQASDPLSAVSDACSLRCRAVGSPQRGKKRLPPF